MRSNVSLSSRDSASASVVEVVTELSGKLRSTSVLSASAKSGWSSTRKFVLLGPDP